MATTALISVEEYLSTSYQDGDREFVDGAVVERNVGEYQHSDVQTAIAFWLRGHIKAYRTVVECRLRIRTSRYRIPDVMLVEKHGPAKPGPVTEVPFLVVEVLSPDDRAYDMRDKIADYRYLGVKYIWVVDPRAQSADIYTAEGSRTVTDGVLRTENPPIEVPFSEIFETE